VPTNDAASTTPGCNETTVVGRGAAQAGLSMGKAGRFEKYHPQLPSTDRSPGGRQGGWGWESEAAPGRIRRVQRSRRRSKPSRRPQSFRIDAHSLKRRSNHLIGNGFPFLSF